MLRPTLIILAAAMLSTATLLCALGQDPVDPDLRDAVHDTTDAFVGRVVGVEERCQPGSEDPLGNVREFFVVEIGRTIRGDASGTEYVTSYQNRLARTKGEPHVEVGGRYLFLATRFAEFDAYDVGALGEEVIPITDPEQEAELIAGVESTLAETPTATPTTGTVIVDPAGDLAGDAARDAAGGPPPPTATAIVRAGEPVACPFSTDATPTPAAA